MCGIRYKLFYCITSFKKDQGRKWVLWLLCEIESVCTSISFHLWLLRDHINYCVSLVNRDCILPESLPVHQNFEW